MKYSGKEEFLANLAADGIILDQMAEKPELHPDLQVDLDIFWQLSSRRTMGFSGPNAITMTDLESCMRVYGIDNWAEKMAFMDRVQLLDNEFLKFHYPPKKAGK